MKKTMIGIMVIMSFVQMACHKEESVQTVLANRVVFIQGEGKPMSTTLFSFFVGHDGAKCPGCVYRYGQWLHVDCQGAGNLCSTSAAVTIHQVGTAIIAMMTDTFGLTSEDFFNMPARSLSTPTIGPEHYLNIPAQVVYRDSAKQQFTFTGLFYSETPAYSNLSCLYEKTSKIPPLNQA